MSYPIILKSYENILLFTSSQYKLHRSNLHQLPSTFNNFSVIKKVFRSKKKTHIRSEPKKR